MRIADKILNTAMAVGIVAGLALGVTSCGSDDTGVVPAESGGDRFWSTETDPHTGTGYRCLNTADGIWCVLP